MDGIKMLKTRQTDRKFLPYSIDLSVIENIVDCARLAPSAKNRQLLRYVVVDDREILNKFAEICEFGKFFTKCPICIAVFSAENDFMVEDASAATQNILLAATAYGLGSCWVGSHNRKHSKEVEKLLGCPETHELVTMIAIGQVEEKWNRPEKKKLADIMSYNKFE